MALVGFHMGPVEKCGFDMGCEFAKGQVLL